MSKWTNSVLALLLLTFGCSVYGSSHESKPEAILTAEIQYLIDYVEKSGCELERNGKRYNSSRAIKHIKRKQRHFADEIATAEDFIRLAATKSTVSGKPYNVICQDQSSQPSARWLQNALEIYRTRKLSNEFAKRKFLALLPS